MTAVLQDMTERRPVALTPVSFLRFAARTFPDHSAWIYESRQVTYREFEERCARLASLLLANEVEIGDIVSIIAPNIPATLELHFAAPMAGAVLNTINTRQDQAHITYILSTAKPKILFVDVEFLSRASEALALSGHDCLVIAINDAETDFERYVGDLEYEKMLARHEPYDYTNASVPEDAPIVLNYTSGTSGKPKGVVHSHRSAYLNATGVALLWNLPIWPNFLWVVPLFHSNGWSLSWAIALRGGTHILKRKVMPAEIFDTLDKHEITHFCCAPTVLDMLLSAENSRGRSDGKPVEIGTGGAAPSSARIQKIRELGFNITHLYGLTETLSCSVYCAPQREWESYSDSELAVALSQQGVAQPMVEEVAVIDVETGERVPKDGATIGEICLRSNTTLTEYFGDADATNEAFFGSWFRTGDLGVCHDNGYVEIRDRSKDIIISGGENVSSLEVEEVMSRHPAIDEVAVVGMPHPKWDEVPCAFVRKGNEATSIDEDEIIVWSRTILPGFKSPKRVVFVDSFPYSATGKIQKNRLRERLVEEINNQITNDGERNAQ